MANLAEGGRRLDLAGRRVMYAAYIPLLLPIVLHVLARTDVFPLLQPADIMFVALVGIAAVALGGCLRAAGWIVQGFGAPEGSRASGS